MSKDYNKMFEENKHMIWHIINKHFAYVKNYGYEEEDIYQVGSIGLYKACVNFDESKKNKFSTYAFPMIHGEISNSFREKHKSFKISRKTMNVFKVIRKREEIGTPEEIAKEFNIGIRYAKEAIDLTGITVSSLNVKNKNDDNAESEFIDTLIFLDQDEFGLTIDKRMELEERLSVLSEKQRQTVEMTLKGMTQREISDILGVSQVQISRNIKNGLKKIQEKYEVAI